MQKGLFGLYIYRQSVKLSGEIWKIYLALPKPLRYDIGSQLLRAADSIGANIAEGYGRYHFKDKIKFYYQARGSLWEVKHWLYLMHQRKLLSSELYENILGQLRQMGIGLNNFIKSTGQSYA